VNEYKWYFRGARDGGTNILSIYPQAAMRSGGFYGFQVPDEVFEKVYYKNAFENWCREFDAKAVPGVREAPAT